MGVHSYEVSKTGNFTETKGWLVPGRICAEGKEELCSRYKAPVTQMNKFWRAVEHHTENFRLALEINVLIPHTNGK